MTPLQEEVVRWIYSLPQTWTPPRWESLSDAQERALDRLIEAGLAEARVVVKATMEGFDEPNRLNCQVSGNYKEQLRRVALTHNPKWVSGDGGTVGRSTFTYDITHVRITADGELARRDLKAGHGFVVPFVTGHGGSHQGSFAPTRVAVEADSPDEGKDVEIDWSDADWQEMPESRAILGFLRTLTPHFTPVSTELSEAEWTGFRALAKKRAAEGVIRITYTHVDGAERTEYFRVKGDYVRSMSTKPVIRSDAPIDLQLVEARLTGTGERWAERLKGESTTPREARASVLSMLWAASPEPGYAELVPPKGKSVATRSLSPDEMEAHAQRALSIIFTSGQKMERLPESYKGKGEEDIRDSLLIALAPQFQSVTGETFNRRGKTDIFIIHDGVEVLVAECKVWSGIDGYLKALDQATGNLVWRDRGAVVIFVRNKNFTAVLEQIENKTKDHLHWKRDAGKQRDGWYTFVFRHPDDPNREVKMDVLSFFFPDVK